MLLPLNIDSSVMRQNQTGSKSQHGSLELVSFFKKMYMYFFAELGLRCCTGFSLVAENGGSSLVAVHGLLIAVASLVAESRLWGTQAFVLATGGLSSCSFQAVGCVCLVSVCGSWA